MEKLGLSPVGKDCSWFTVFTNVSTQGMLCHRDFKFHQGEASWKEGQLSVPSKQGGDQAEVLRARAICLSPMSTCS